MSRPTQAGRIDVITPADLAAAVARFAAEFATIERDEDGDVWVIVHRGTFARSAGVVIADPARRSRFAPYYQPVSNHTAASETWADYEAEWDLEFIR